MGLICTKLNPSSDVEQENKGQTTTKNPPAANEKNAKKKSLAYFDAQDKEPVKKELESIREKFRGSVYLSALDNIEIGQDGEILEEEEESSFHYAPATGANPHPRASVVFDDGSTMLRKHYEKNKLMASAVITQELKQPSQKAVCAEGYPGELTPSELEACQLFRRGLKEKDPAYYEMVLSMTPAEEEPYAICRFLRARNFQVDAAIEMMDESIDLWKDASKHDFYPSVEVALGCSAAAFYTQFPSVYHGLAKNGTVIVFLRAGAMSVEGIECLTELDALGNWLWTTAKYKVPKHVTELQAANPQNVVRCEETYIIDLKNLTSSQVSKTAIDAMKNMFAPSACYPEILNKTVILNAPTFFSFLWRVVKSFLNPRTAQKVDIFSGTDKGNRRLKELIGPEYIPSNYGGEAPSLDELAAKQYCGEGRRQIHHLFSLTKHGKADWKFTLNAKEQASSITVYSRSSEGADFTVALDNKSIANKCCVKSNGEKGPYAKEIASKLEGSGTFQVTAESKSNQTENFLVIVSIISM